MKREISRGDKEIETKSYRDGKSERRGEGSERDRQNQVSKRKCDI